MTKILHLLSDRKFVDGHIYRFEQANFNNSFIFIAEAQHYNGMYSDLVQQVTAFSSAFDNLIQNAGHFDAVIAYNLDYPKSFLINRLNNHIPVIWYFYGTELYGELPAFKYSLHSGKTKKIAGMHLESRFMGSLKRIASQVKYAVIRQTPTYTEIARAIQRVNYLALFSIEEYQYLQHHSKKKLPAYLHLPVYVKAQTAPIFPKPATGLLLGHAATPDANHIDIIDILCLVGYAGKVVVPLSYGENDKYTRQIKQVLLRSGLQVTILDSFMDVAAYAAVVNYCSCAVFNSYRQLALGNILLSLRSLLKVYLHETNPSYQWLLNNGFIIFSIQQDLKQDLKAGQLGLLPQQAAINRQAYEKLTDPDKNNIFLQEITRIAGHK